MTNPMTKAAPVITPATAIFHQDTREACDQIADTYQTVIAMKGDTNAISITAHSALGGLARIIEQTLHPALAVHALHMTYAYGVNPMLVDATDGSITSHATGIMDRALHMSRNQSEYETALLMTNNLALEEKSVGYLSLHMVNESCLMQCYPENEKRNQAQLALAAKWTVQNRDKRGWCVNLASRAIMEMYKVSGKDIPHEQTITAYYRDLNMAFTPAVTG